VLRRCCRKAGLVSSAQCEGPRTRHIGRDIFASLKNITGAALKGYTALHSITSLYLSPLSSI
jgi:uncharacterized protein YbjQ (UPF0145 family)